MVNLVFIEEWIEIKKTKVGKILTLVFSMYNLKFYSNLSEKKTPLVEIDLSDPAQ